MPSVDPSAADSALAGAPGSAASAPAVAGGGAVPAGSDPSYDPATGGLRGLVAHSTPERVAELLRAAATAARPVGDAAPAERRAWIEAAATAVLARADELVAVAEQETRLGLPRLTGELQNMVRHARFYAEVAVEGSSLDLRVDRTPLGTLTRWNTTLGPVAVFGASNFPFGFGVFGHDVASALAAGCPVLVKAHPAHPRLSVLLAGIVAGALHEAGAPEGTYALVVGFDAGLQLVDAPEVAAVCFTGSQAGGMALVERAAARGVPVFAEMGTVNPVFVSPHAAYRRDEIAVGFVGSFTLGAGQFCTKPGLLLAPAGQGYPETIAIALAAIAPAPLLTAAIARRYSETVPVLRGATGPDTATDASDTATDAAPDAAPDAESTAPAAIALDGYRVAPTLIRATLPDLVDGSPLLEECFGPVAVVVEYDSVDEALATLTRLQPSLAASVFTASGTPGDGADDEATEPDEAAARAIRTLLPRVGRVAVDGWPTGVAAAWAQQHGGPWPATSRPEATSVGAAALDRFTRPVTVQNAAEGLLPPFARSDNPWRVPRRLDGVIVPPAPAPTASTDTAAAPTTTATAARPAPASAAESENPA